tara:strand:- start:14188 stop:14925 length:738 start_codon:yes stop_codon:yes gene_type:complete
MRCTLYRIEFKEQKQTELYPISFFNERDSSKVSELEEEKRAEELKKVSRLSSFSEVDNFLLNYSIHSLLGGKRKCLSCYSKYDSFLNEINDSLKNMVKENILIYSVILGKNHDVEDSYLERLKEEYPYIDIIQSNNDLSTIYYVGNSLSLNKYLFLPSFNFKGKPKDDLIYLDNIESLMLVSGKYFIEKIYFNGTKEEAEKISTLYKWFINKNMVFLMPIFETENKECAYIFEELVEYYELLYKK